MIEPEDTSQKIFTAGRLARGLGYFQGAGPFITPDVNDDWTQGFQPGSFWYTNGTPERLWLNVDSTDGGAIWREMPLAFARSPHVVFQEYTSVATGGTTAEALYSHDVVNKLVINGDVLHVYYAGNLDDSASSKTIILRIDGNDTTALTVAAETVTRWTLDAYFIRVNATTLRFALKAVAKNAVPGAGGGEIGTTIDVTNFNIELVGVSPVNAGDVTVESCYAVMMPALATEEPLAFLTTGLEFGGDTVAFTP